jgi:hypothetical protein
MVSKAPVAVVGVSLAAMPLGDGTYPVDPGPGLSVAMALSVLGLIAGTVTAAKETSVWARIRARRAMS